MTATMPPTGEVPVRRLWSPSMAAKYMNNGMSPRFVRRLMKEGRIATCDPYMNDRLLTWREAVDEYLASTVHSASEKPTPDLRPDTPTPRRKSTRNREDDLTWQRVRQKASGGVIPLQSGGDEVIPLTNDGILAPEITDGSPWDMLNKIRERKAARRRSAPQDQPRKNHARISP